MGFHLQQNHIAVLLLRDQMKARSLADVGERIRWVWGKGLRSVGGYRWYLDTVGMVKLFLVEMLHLFNENVENWESLTIRLQGFGGSEEIWRGTLL